MGSSRASSATSQPDNTKRSTTSPVAEPPMRMSSPQVCDMTTHHEHNNRSPTNMILSVQPELDPSSSGEETRGHTSRTRSDQHTRRQSLTPIEITTSKTDEGKLVAQTNNKTQQHPIQSRNLCRKVIPQP